MLFFLLFYFISTALNNINMDVHEQCVSLIGMNRTLKLFNLDLYENMTYGLAKRCTYMFD